MFSNTFADNRVSVSITAPQYATNEIAIADWLFATDAVDVTCRACEASRPDNVLGQCYLFEHKDGFRSEAYFAVSSADLVCWHDLLNRGGDAGMIRFEFTNADHAMLFKLTFGGAA